MSKYSNFSGGGGKCEKVESKYANFSGGGGNSTSSLFPNEQTEQKSNSIGKSARVVSSSTSTSCSIDANVISDSNTIGTNKKIISNTTTSTDMNMDTIMNNNSNNIGTKKPIVSTTIGTETGTSKGTSTSQTNSNHNSNIKEFPSNQKQSTDFQKEEEEKIDRIMDFLEKMRKENPLKFGEIMMINKKFMDTVNNYKDKSDLDILDDLIFSINYNIDLLYWSFNKGLKAAILEKKNIELVHFFIIKHKIRLDTFFFRYIVADYIESFKDLNFIDIEDDKIELYTLILEIMVTAGRANAELPNENTRKTAFHLAVQYNQYQFIIFLARLGVNIDHFDKDFKTPLDVAIDKSLNGDLVAKEIVNLLYSMNARAFKHFDYKEKHMQVEDNDESSECLDKDKLINNVEEKVDEIVISKDEDKINEAKI